MELNTNLGALARIKDSYPSLRRSETMVAVYMLSNPEEVPGMTITELARASRASEATISRLCRSLGYDGFQDLKISLARDIAVKANQQSPSEIDPQDDTATVARKLAHNLAASLETAYERLPLAEVDRAVEALAGARQIAFYGIGGSAFVAWTAHHMFLKAGFASAAYGDGYMQAISAALLGPGDVAMGISHSGDTFDVIEALEAARENGATTICLTSDPAAPIIEQADIRLITEGFAQPLFGEFMEARFAQMYVINLVYLCVARKRHRLTMERLDKTSSTAKRGQGAAALKLTEE